MSRAVRVREQQWGERFNELTVYHKKNGNCNVPPKQGGLNKLAHWVNDQRRYYKDGKLSQERTKQLEGIGFYWSVAANKWKERFNALAAYQKKNGNCNVPAKQGKLGKWVDHQRQFYKKGKLSQERIVQLESIDFNWTVLPKWEERLKDLAAYQQKNGNCNVSSKDGALGNWVSDQRKCFKKGKLSLERTTQLEGIGFAWKLKLGPASTQVPSDLPVDESNKKAGRGSIDLVGGMSNSEFPALPPVYDYVDTKSNTLPSDSQVTTRDCATDTRVTGNTGSSFSQEGMTVEV